MSKDFKSAINIILRHEGGYVDDPTDRGGETNFGISKRAHPNVDIPNLTEEEAKRIYWEHYWIPSKVGSLPTHLRASYFDMCVNHGRQNAVKILQRACNNKGKRQIAVDGIIGPNTILRAQRLEKKRLLSYRILFFANIVTSKPSQEKFWYGWFRRTISFN